MKKIIYIALTVAAAFCFSCTKQDYYDISLSNREIGFSTYSGRSVETKAESPDPFLVEAYYKGSKYFDAQTVTFSNSVWNLSTAYFWPATVDPSNQMEFYAVRKKSGESYTFTGKVVTVSTALAADADIRTSYAAATAVPDGAQALNFTHDLAKMEFTLKAADPNLTYTVTAMKVTAKKTGTLTLNTDTRTWATTGSAADYSITGFTPSPNTTQGSVFGETNIIPQNNVVISVTYSVATPGGVTVLASTTKTKTIDLSANRGKSTQYNISLPSGASGTAEMTVSCSVTDWNSQTDVNQAWNPEFVGVKQTFDALTTAKQYRISGLLLKPSSSVTVNYGDTGASNNEEVFSNTTASDMVCIPTHTYSSTGSKTVTYTISSGTAELLPVFGVAESTSSSISLLSTSNRLVCISNVEIAKSLSNVTYVSSSNNGKYYMMVTFNSVPTALSGFFSINFSWTSIPTSVTELSEGGFWGVGSPNQSASDAGVFFFPDAVTSVNAGYWGQTGASYTYLQTSKGIFSSNGAKSGFTATLGNGTEVTFTYSICVPAGTPILVSFDGETKMVEDLVAGDDIVAWSEKDEKNVLTNVKSLIITQHTTKVEMTLANGDVLTMSEGHPLLTEDGWKAYTPTAPDCGISTTTLSVGDKVFTYDGTFSEITSLRLMQEDIQMYMPDVNDDYDTYYALGKNGTIILSHNY